jgi:nitric oxide reductase large subunit
VSSAAGSGAPGVHSISAATKDPAAFTRKVLDAGFVTALALACGCLLFGAVYLYRFLESTNASLDRLLVSAASSAVSESTLQLAIQGRTVMARIALQSCGVFVAMAFGFLGFGLFLIGAKGDMDLDARSEAYQVKLARMSPGIFVLLAATVLLALCITRETPFTYRSVAQPAGGGLPTAAEIGPHLEKR